MMVHIVWVKNLVKHFFFFQTEGFTDTSQDGISRKVLTNLTAWHDSSVSSHVLHTWLFTSYSSYELVANCTNSSLTLDSSPISHTHPLQINPHKYIEMIEEITIKFGLVGNHNFTYIMIFVSQPPSAFNLLTKPITKDFFVCSTYMHNTIRPKV